MTNHSRHFTFDADENLIDYLIEKVTETVNKWPEDCTNFDESWVESFIFDYKIWDEAWTCMTKEQQSELMDYVVSYVSDSYKASLP